MTLRKWKSPQGDETGPVSEAQGPSSSKVCLGNVTFVPILVRDGGNVRDGGT